MSKILIVDDDEPVRTALFAILEENRYLPVEASSGKQALTICKKEEPAAILLDLKMPDMDGIQTMKELRKAGINTPIIMITGYADISTAVEAIKLGAYDFLTKPPQIDKLILTIQRVIEKNHLEQSLKQLDNNIESSLEWVFGKSDAIKNVIRQIRQVAWSDFSVLVQGETGTGKSLVAQTIHNMSKRAEKIFQTVDAGVIPGSLIESELFGHEKGAFTGADKRKKGFFEIADTGTLFIDELENMPQYMQGKLLRAVEEKKIYPLGMTKPVSVDVRIIAATNTDIRQAVREKAFRQDLFYRLNEFTINLPPLKDRIEDVPFLANKFIVKASLELNKQVSGIDSDALSLLVNYPWPGNVRELKNVVRRAVLLSKYGNITKENLEFLLEERGDRGDSLPTLPLKKIAALVTKDAEKKVIKRVLTTTNGNKTKAASILEIDYKTLLTKIKEYNL
ncbi:MAG: Transcriptional regulatory protein ZraR [Syntrophorhabdus sp. PtaU1.Bin058]|nr:MAG: Transcriptional regulatory protein ZraR [Syntrophorhabdus sp. PtaU1.Bin058]